LIININHTGRSSTLKCINYKHKSNITLGRNTLLRALETRSDVLPCFSGGDMLDIIDRSIGIANMLNIPTAVTV